MQLFSRALSALILGIALLAGSSVAHPSPTAQESPVGLDEKSWQSLRGAVAKAIGQEARLSAPSVLGADGANGDELGYSIGIDGDTALVGARADDIGRDQNQGAAYVFTRSGGVWTQQAKLTADDGGAGHVFGRAVALEGDTALIGADGQFSGSFGGGAYVFARSGETWSQTTLLQSTDLAASDRFGAAVALEGDTALVGALARAEGANGGQGAAYVFARDGGGTWSQAQKLLNTTSPAANEFFGASVALSGDSAVIGAYGVSASRGAAFVFTRSAGIWTEQASLSASNGDSGDRFGWSVAVQGDTAVVGATHHTVEVGGNFNDRQGAVYVFTRSGASWSEQTRLSASEGSEDDRFGHAVALSAGSLGVGAIDFNRATGAEVGAGFVFTGSGSSWSEQSTLSAGIGKGEAELGFAVALDGDRALIGLPKDSAPGNLRQGSAILFSRDGGSWTQLAQLTALDGDVEDRFGHSVALSGNTALVGAYQHNSGRGAAYVFTGNGSSWTQQAKLSADDAQSGDYFGWSVALDGDTAVIGAYLEDNPFANAGSAYVFTRSAELWTQQAKLGAPSQDAGLDDHFGYSVAIDGDTLLVGANREEGAVLPPVSLNATAKGGGCTPSTLRAGAVYVFTGSGASWTQQAKLFGSDSGSSDLFGEAVALQGNYAIVGAPNHCVASGPIEEAGAAYVFVRDSGSWSEQAKLVASDAAFQDRFGHSVALSGVTALVGAIGADAPATDQGAAYAFTRGGSSWSQQGKLVASDGAIEDRFGAAVAIDSGNALIGANQVAGEKPFGNPAEGAAYVFNGILNAPGAPIIGTASRGAGSATVSFSAPVSDGNSAITSYTATSQPGGFSSSGCTGSPCTVSGLDNGTAYTFTVTATNALGTGPASAPSNILAANLPPTIGLPASFEMPEDGSGSVAITVGDDLTPAGDLSLQVSGDNAGLITDAALSAGLGGSGANRTLAFSPVADASGSAQVTITVSDGFGASSQAQLALTVLAVNDPPSAQFGNSPTWPAGESGEKQATNFVSALFAGAVDEAAQNVSIALAVDSDPDGVLQPGSVSLETNGTLRYTLTGNGGAARLRLQAVDDGGTANGGSDRGALVTRRILVGEVIDLSVSIRRGQPVGKQLAAALAKGSTMASYTVEVRHVGNLDASDVRLRVNPIVGLNDVLWSCDVPCTPPNGGGTVDTTFNLAAGGLLQLGLSGSVDNSVPFVEITAQVTLPPGVTAVFRNDDRRVLIESTGGTGIFKNGME